MAEICQIRSEITSKTELFDVTESDLRGYRNVPASLNQWWRLIVPLFVHAGAIQTVLCMVAQYYCGQSIETQAGFLRTMLIYFISGLGGNIVSAIFSPRSLAAGSDPAVYGLMGVMLSELMQAWQVVPSRWWHLAKLMSAIVVTMLIGTLPYVDNWSHLGGLVFGIISGIVFLPYITFGKWDARRKKLLLYLCVPLLIFLILMALLTFYKLSNTDNICAVNAEGINICGYFNCIAWPGTGIDCAAYY